MYNSYNYNVFNDSILIPIYQTFLAYWGYLTIYFFNYFDELMTKSKRKYYIYSKAAENHYLVKYNLLFNNDNNYFNIQLHHFVDSDSDINLHDHDRDYYSFLLKGSYLEKCFIYDNNKKIITTNTSVVNKFLPNNISKSNHCHSISLINNISCWLLIISFNKTSTAGFWVKEDSTNEYIWVDFKKYYENNKYCVLAE